MKTENARQTEQAASWQTCWPQQAEVSERAAALLQTQSLTRALRSLGGRFSVTLRHLGERCAGGFWPAFAAQERLFVREVHLCLDGEAVVWAQSVCAADSVFWRSLLDCGTQPLGERLFDGSLNISRSPLEYVSPLPPACWSAVGSGENGSFQTAFAARRSLFAAPNGDLLGLAECFLPALKSYLP